MIKMSSSILDYIFRELAISYLDRADLGHVNSDDLAMDAMGAGEEQSDLARATISTGFVRNRNIVLLHGKGTGTDGEPTMSASTMAVTEQDTGAVTTQSGASTANSSIASQVQQARMQGYEGENCNECGNFTLVRNGTCLKCNTCGSTTGCS